MKNTIIIAMVCISLGFAASWLIKPDTVATTEAVAPSRPPSRATSASTPNADQARLSSRRDAAHREMRPSREIDPERTKAMEEAQNRQAEMVRKRLADKNELNIVAMVKELGLNASQEKALRAFYAEQMEKIALDGGIEAFSDAAKMKEIAAALRGDGLNDAMQNTFSAEQMKNLEAMQERKKNNKIESMAMRDLSKLQQSLDLSEDQKQKVYDVLMEDAEQSISSQSDTDYVTRTMMSNMGLDIDLGDMDMGSLMGMSPEGENAAQDPAAMLKKIQEDRQTKIDAKVQRLAPLLSESQQQQYRKSLESQGGMMNMLLQGMGDAEAVE